MKKIVLAALATALAMSAAQAADYPPACSELEDLTVEAGKLMPEMQAQLDASGTEEERKEAAREAWAKMSEAEQQQAASTCDLAVEQMKQIIAAVKAQN